MQNLTVLLINNNKITQLPKQILMLRKLITLDISNNDLSDLPYEVAFIKSLTRLQLEGNPLKCIRGNIRASGAEGIKKYLKTRVPENQIKELEEFACPDLKKTLYKGIDKKSQI